MKLKKQDWKGETCWSVARIYVDRELDVNRELNVNRDLNVNMFTQNNKLYKIIFPDLNKPYGGTVSLGHQMRAQWFICSSAARD